MAAGANRQSGPLERSREIVSRVLFLFFAVFFTISALRSGDVPGLIGALLFLLACVVFLVPRAARAFGVSGRNDGR